MQAFEGSAKLDIAAGQHAAVASRSRSSGWSARRLIRAEQRPVGVTPRATSVALTAVFKRVHLNYARAERHAGPSP